MAGNGRRCRSRRNYAADVAQTVRAGALSRQDLMSRPASGRLTALLKLDVEQLKEAVAAPPRSNAGPVADGRKPSLGRQMRRRRLQRVAAPQDTAERRQLASPEWLNELERPPSCRSRRTRTCSGTHVATRWRTNTRALQGWLGHMNIQHTVRYTELSPMRFKDFWRK
jgi:hypothetical protein